MPALTSILGSPLICYLLLGWPALGGIGVHRHLASYLIIILSINVSGYRDTGMPDGSGVLESCSSGVPGTWLLCFPVPLSLGTLDPDLDW
jgi:hypothetical protein